MQDDRWEVRVFPEEDAASITRAMTEGADGELEAGYRTDIYLLASDERLLPKIRGGELFEIKELIEEKGGCARWMMAVSAPFPVAGETLSAILPSAALMDDAKSLCRAGKEAGLQVIEVRKHRRLFAFGESRAEITDVMAEGRTWRSFGIETPQLEDCRELARSLHLADHENEDYGGFLRRTLR